VPLWSIAISPNGRRPVSTRIEVVTREALAAAWPRHEAVSLVDRRHPSGRLIMRIDHHARAGYFMAAPRHGTHVISNNGRSVRSALPRAPQWRWQRLLFAQVLPLTAALQGLELYHASAVALDDRVFAFIAPSGIGKTSVAAHLLALGARFVTDDVLALEQEADRVVAHPGPAWASLTPGELLSIPDEARGRLGTVVGRSDKVYLELAPVNRALPLGGIYFLARGRGSGRLQIDEVRTSGAQRLLASSFLWYLATPEHLLTHLEVSAHIAASVPMFDVRIPSGVAAPAVAAAVERHARGRP
jgi:hypothetical protein